MNTLRPPKQLSTIVVMLLMCIFNGNAQDVAFVVPDSLKNLTYDEVFKKFTLSFRDSLKSKVYLNTIYNKAVSEDNDYRRAQALNNMIYYEDSFESKEELSRLAIYYAEKSGVKEYLMLCHSYSGGLYLDLFKYDIALQHYLKSLALAQEVGNEDYVYINKNNIAIIKSDIGNYAEALKLFKECYDREIGLGDKGFLYDYLSTTLSLSETFMRHRQPDSANFYIDEAFKRNAKHEPILYSQFKVYEALTESISLNEKYTNVVTALNGLDTKDIESKRILLIGHYHTALINKEKSYKHYKKVDSIFEKSYFFLPEVRKTYENLITYYKKNKNQKSQLQYVDKLLKFDSTYLKQQRLIGSKLFSLYDTPVLLSEKEMLIKELDRKNNTLSYGALSLVLIASISILITLHLYRRTRRLKIKFRNIIEANPKKSNADSVDSTVKVSNIPLKKKSLNVPSEIVAEVLEKLEKFEKENAFLAKNITSSSLAKKAQTNSKYLSQIINFHKQKTIVTYINDLRLEYFISEVQSNKKLMNYTIQSMAEEVGFNTSESFSKAFTKKTGLKPSYFIKKLKNRQL